MDRARLIELLASLSLAGDAADGFAPQTTVRAALLAADLAAEVGDERLVADALYGGLVRHIGCTGFAVEEARRYGAGDDVALRATMATVDFGQPEDAVRRIGAGLAPDAAGPEREAAIGNLLGDGPAAEAGHHAAQCDAGERLAALLPLSPGARLVPTEAFERWDGAGGPAGLAGDAIALVTRIVELAYQAELFRSRDGVDGALAALEARAGGHLDPDLFAAHRALLEEQLRTLGDPGVAVWDLVLEREPEPVTTLSAAQVEQVALAFGRFSDLKSPWFTGHAEHVARLAATAAEAQGLGAEAVTRLRVAALVHDLGRVGIATGTWELPRPLSRPERDRVDLHAWETARICGATPLLADVAALAGAAHERLDASGYHRGLGAAALDAPSRVLAAADVAAALVEDRPHRPALDPSAAADVLAAEVADGRLDREAVAAVLAAAGQRSAPVPWPAGLSDREVEVVRLVASGATNKDVARALGISAKTVAHHVAHVYDKIGTRSRAGTTLFALEHGLVGPGAGRG